MQGGNFSDPYGNFPNQFTQQGGGGLNTENRSVLQMPQNAPNQQVPINQPARVEQARTFEQPTVNQRSTNPQQTGKPQRLPIQKPLPSPTQIQSVQADEPEDKTKQTKKLMTEFNNLSKNYKRPGILNLMEKILIKIMNLWR
jgi:hypothetical protein